MHNYFSSIFQRLKGFFLLFLFVENSLRLAFFIREWNSLDGGFATVLKGFGVGVLFDLYLFSFFACIYTLLDLIVINRLKNIFYEKTLFFLFLYLLIFTTLSEWIFWQEFQSRFNFIAVDYLVYTHEVIGNIFESYPVKSLLVSIFAASSLLTWLLFRNAQKFKKSDFNFRTRLRGFCCFLAVSFLGYCTIALNLAEVSNNNLNNQINRNGVIEIFYAFFNNELNYYAFYPTKPLNELTEKLQKKLGIREPLPGISQIKRTIAADKEALGKNLIVVVVESLSADFLGSFGNKEGLTPYLDKLAEESLIYTQLYATGTRTVYGLSAVTLSIPPLPGNAISRRPNSKHLVSLGSILKGQGYSTQFLYGGFGYFDSMNAFYSSNGYAIVDRSNLSREEISFANIWGVCDEDLFKRVILEGSKKHLEGKPFFQIVMTTSNHRPFTYPEGRIDIPSYTGRKGGVKYTDYAIGFFLENCKKEPWFEDTIFVFVADHTAGSAGKMDLDPKKYHIPLFIYAPKFIEPKKVDHLMSQIDIAPTLLGLLNISYESPFFGQDVSLNPPERAFISNYQQLGYLTPDWLILLKPTKVVKSFRRKGQDYVMSSKVPEDLLDEALMYFQCGEEWKTWNKEEVR